MTVKAAQWLLAAMVAGALALHMGGLLQLAYPAAAMALGVWLYRRDPAAYVSYVLWLWMLTPLVRRLADWQAGWRDPSLLLLTPFLVTAWPAVLRLGGQLLALASFARDPSRRHHPSKSGLLFPLAALAIAIAVPFGVMASGSAAAVTLLNWAVPLGFGWATAASVRPEDTERSVAATFRYAPIVLGAYAIWQFTNPQPWDAEWMVNSEMTTIGRPEPFTIRVFSTMHSPGVLAAFLVVPLTLWMARPTLPGLPGACLGFIAVVLSQVRTAWLALAVAAVFVPLRLPHRLRFRFAVMAAIAVLCVAPFMLSPDVAEMASARFGTLADTDDDDSAVARVEGHLLALDFVGAHPLGNGLGVEDPRVAQLVGINDGLLVGLLVQFGIVGTSLYIGSLMLVLIRLWRYYRTAASPEATGLACAGLGLFATAGLGAMSVGVPGVLFWLIAGLAATRFAGGRAPQPTIRLTARRQPHWPHSRVPVTEE